MEGRLMKASVFGSFVLFAGVTVTALLGCASEPEPLPAPTTHDSPAVKLENTTTQCWGCDDGSWMGDCWQQCGMECQYAGDRNGNGENDAEDWDCNWTCRNVCF
jgi:hypothetical protein